MHAEAYAATNALMIWYMKGPIRNITRRQQGRGAEGAILGASCLEDVFRDYKICFPQNNSVPVGASFLPCLICHEKSSYLRNP